MAIFYNQATLSYNDTVINSNIVTGRLVGAVTAAKTAVSETYAADEVVTYAVSIVNTGTAAVTNVTVTDDLGEYPFCTGTRTPLTYVEGTALLLVNGSVQEEPEAEAGPPLVISGFTIPAGGNAVLIYQARVNSYAPLGADASITNTVTITAGCGMTPITAEETITAETEASLTITKSLCPEVVTENGELTYTFVIRNTGNTPIVATDDAVVTDIFDPILDITAVTFNGATWTEPANYTYNDNTGEFATVEGQITVPAATYSQDPVTGAWIIEPGVSVLRVTGTV